ncbi:MAG: hypothetical protein DMF61_15945 [Blastocatellia bacterium AA13]|nr:MAG: hypothetical protein DMF61_15945 [Blastocatellia bacterium AA13]
MTAKKMTVEGFLEEFLQRHEQMKDRPFCWVLGSGASVQSGILTGAALVKRWLEDIHLQEDFSKQPIEKWATAENLDIPGFEYEKAASFYPYIYQRRFRHFKEHGYAFLESAMEHAEPSFGYSVLAQIMAFKAHSVAVTTNFDNLVADALSIYTRTFPLVCGHESLTGYIRPNPRRPLVAKIHRDLLLQPFSNPDEIANLSEEWKAALKRIFSRFAPIVIGYGGNDGSLMGYLKEAEAIDGGIFWCHLDGETVDQAIHEVVERHRGRLVPIAGFDELMLQLQEKLKLPSALPELERAHKKRSAEYQKSFEELNAKLSKKADTEEAEEARKPVREAAKAAADRFAAEESWWAWYLKAESESDPEEKEEIYRAGLRQFLESAELTGAFANFMTYVRKNHEEAEKLYRRALELDPNHARNTGNFANFMTQFRKNHDEAERLYRKALELDPNRAIVTGNFAVFMLHVRKNYDEAEKLYRRALELDPNYAIGAGNYTGFLVARGRLDEAAEMATRARALNKGQTNQLAAEIALYSAILSRLKGDDAVEPLEELRRLFKKGFEREAWNFDEVLAVAHVRLSLPEYEMFSDLAHRILDDRDIPSSAPSTTF